MASYTYSLNTSHPLGDNGGAPFDPRVALPAATGAKAGGAWRVGCGARGARLSRLRIHAWSVLSHLKATYALQAAPDETAEIAAGDIVASHGAGGRTVVPLPFALAALGCCVDSPLPCAATPRTHPHPPTPPDAPNPP
jgi:hypothetical protein